MPTQYKSADSKLRGFVSLADDAQKVAEELLGLGYPSYIPREMCNPAILGQTAASVSAKPKITTKSK